MGDAEANTDRPAEPPEAEPNHEPDQLAQGELREDLHGAAEAEPNREPDRLAQPVDAEEPPRLPFPVVGVGASAGGLEAFIELFKVMPPDSGMAFVLIQHLPPERESLIASILSAHTKMPVLDVDDGMRVERNHVYLIRPGRTLTIKDGVLHLGERLEKPGHSRPVDDFFKSLAEEQRERAICIVLSGMGSNGTAGAQAIKAVGGVGIAQDPESAKFPSMPRHVIDAGCVDFVLRPQDMPDVLLSYAEHPYATTRRSADAILQRERQNFKEILALLRARTRHDFSGYKKPTILRRIERRMGLSQLTSMAEYVKLLRQNASEISALSDDLMIHVTGFFRDAEAWEAMREKVILPLIAERENEGVVRCWVTACSSGEEAYTLAMLLTEVAEDFGKRLDIKVFATDMAEPEMQRRVLALLHFGLRENGILFLGSSETVGPAEELFEPIDKKMRIFRRVGPTRHGSVDFPLIAAGRGGERDALDARPTFRASIAQITNKVLLDRYTPAAVTVDREQRIVFFHGDTDPYLTQPRGQPTRDLLAMTRDSVRGATRTAIHKAMTQTEPVTVRDGVIPTERDLRDAKERLSMAQRAARCGTWVRDLVEGSVLWSVELCELMGVVADDAKSMTAEAARALIHVDDREERDRLLADKVGRGDPEWLDVSRFLHATRGYLWLESRGKILYDDAGSALRVVGISTDVTDRKRSEEELERNQRLFKRIVEASPDVVFIYNLEADRTTYASSRSGEVLDYIGDEITGTGNRMVTRMVHPSDALKVADHMRAMREMEDGQVYEFEYRSLHRDGSHRYIHARSTVFARGEDGRVREIIGFLQDATERRRSEADLRASEERSRLLIEGAKDFAMLMLDPDGRIMSWNSGAERVLGFSEEDAVGQRIAIIYTPEDRADAVPEREIEEARKTGRAIDERWHIRKDMSRFWGSGVLTALRNGDGGIRGFVKVFRDETARRQAEAERDDLLEREKTARRAAEEAMRLRDQFVATMSHELRTPLSAILLWAKLLRKGTIAPERTGEGLEAIERSAEAQKQLIDDLLDTSRIRSGKLRLEMRETMLAPLVQVALDTIAPTADAKRVQIDVDIDHEVGRVLADPDRLRQVIWNLLSNAVKFTQAGGRIRVALARVGGEIEIRVSDTGRGIDSRFLERVFAPFSQADSASTRVQGGLGLGLSISKELVELHGGTIRAESPGPGRGATFIVRLPLPEVRRSADTNVEGAPLRLAWSASDARLHGARVLLVEDAEDTREPLVLLLKQKGAEVVAVNSLETALEAYQLERPDIIVSDIGLGGEDGYDLMRRIRALEESQDAPPVPSIAVTAFAREDDIRLALRSGFLRHLGKPVEPEQLIWVMTQLLEGD